MIAPRWGSDRIARASGIVATVRPSFITGCRSQLIATASARSRPPCGPGRRSRTTSGSVPSSSASSSAMRWTHAVKGKTDSGLAEPGLREDVDAGAAPRCRLGDRVQPLRAGAAAVETDERVARRRSRPTVRGRTARRTDPPLPPGTSPGSSARPRPPSTGSARRRSAPAAGAGRSRRCSRASAPRRRPARPRARRAAAPSARASCATRISAPRWLAVKAAQRSCSTVSMSTPGEPRPPITTHRHVAGSACWSSTWVEKRFVFRWLKTRTASPSPQPAARRARRPSPARPRPRPPPREAARRRGSLRASSSRCRRRRCAFRRGARPEPRQAPGRRAAPRRSSGWRHIVVRITLVIGAVLERDGR